MKRTASVFFFLLLLQPPLLASDWVKLGVDYNLDVSGLVLLEQTDSSAVLLVAHDNKYPHENRLGLVTLAKQSATYEALEFPEDAIKPIDLESLSRHPDGGYITLTSKGTGLHFDIDRSAKRIVERKRFPLVFSAYKKLNFEGIQIVKHGNEYRIFWADRGKNKRPGILYWANWDQKNYAASQIQQVLISVPEPATPDVRHITEFRILETGAIYISSASEVSNDGPFASAFYRAGTFDFVANSVSLVPPEKIAPLYSFPDRKVEGFDFSQGTLFVATDDENLGSFLRKLKALNWREPTQVGSLHIRKGTHINWRQALRCSTVSP